MMLFDDGDDCAVSCRTVFVLSIPRLKLVRKQDQIININHNNEQEQAQQGGSRAKSPANLLQAFNAVT